MSAKKAPAKKKAQKGFYTLSLTPEKDGDLFYPEYSILVKTIESVNNFYDLYKVGRRGASGPSTHEQQDLYRAMLVFACAGLDVFVKKLVKEKLPELIPVDQEVEKKFVEYAQKGLRDEKVLSSTLALALVSSVPRTVFLNEYIKSMTDDSLQSVEALCTVSRASGLDTKKIFNKTRIDSLREAFTVRNEIIHEMDINTDSKTSGRTTGHRTRRQRVSTAMEKHTQSILDLGQELLTAYKDKFQKFRIGVLKPTVPKAPTS